ncbi:MAG: hypothetical protein MZU95_00420 [Desulfomicrobium escambiense]|nr:hypothetical protein [Desulfomicrobium escambiense]
MQKTENAKVLLDGKMFVAVVQKGKDKKYDSYSGFQDDGGAKTELDRLLKKAGMTGAHRLRPGHGLLREGHRPGRRQGRIQGDGDRRPEQGGRAGHHAQGPGGDDAEGRDGQETARC